MGADRVFGFLTLQQKHPKNTRTHRTTQGAIEIIVEMHFTNGPEEDVEREFSAEERGMLGLSIAFFLLQTLIMVGMVVDYVGLKNTGTVLPTFRFFQAVVGGFWLKALFMLCYWAKYADTGSVTRDVKYRPFSWDTKADLLHRR